MDVTICHFFKQPQRRAAVAALIHNEFWAEVPGASVEKMAARLGEASTADAVPLCLIALNGDEVLGAINLVDNDDDDHTDWHPWLAGMVVAAPHRGQGIGSRLVRGALEAARAQGLKVVARCSFVSSYLGKHPEFNNLVR